jgi:DNA-directed RNA polymerase alpha subunit
MRENSLDMPLSELGLSTRAMGALRYDFATVRELIACSADELGRIPNLGKVTLAEVRIALARHGRSLREDKRPSIDERLAAIDAKLEDILIKLDALGRG